MAFLHLTAAAERTLIRLKGEVTGDVSPVTLSFRLLSNLLDDEGHAAELLRSVSISEATLQSRIEQIAAVPTVNYMEWQRALLRRADAFAIEHAEDGITGTEHLLLAVVNNEPVVAEWLNGFELYFEEILRKFTSPSPNLSVAGVEIGQIRPVEQGAMDAAALARIMDASANRCREGLRVVEDYVRFHLDDATLQRELKQIRHRLTQALRHIGQERWVPSRDSLGDVGPLGTLATERSRESLVDVIRANFKRIEESLRSLEEYGKLIDSEVASSISECRYKIYTVEKAMETILSNRHRLEKCRLYLLVTAANCRYSPEIVIRNSLEKGVDVVQIREKDMSVRDLMRYGKQVREWTNQAGALFIMNDRADVAAAVGADGVHLGQDDLDVVSARRLLGGTGIIGVSTHEPEQARQALFDGADYFGVGPVFQSRTKVFSEFAGLDYVQHVSLNFSLPWFPIGGIHQGNLKSVLQAGATRVAVSSAICQDPDPRGVTADLAGQLRAHAEFQAFLRKVNEERGPLQQN